MSLNNPTGQNAAFLSAKPLGGRYQLVRQLAIGGFGQTFVARDLHLPGLPLCVVKQLKAQRDIKTLRVARRLFEQEAAVLYSLAHPQIPKLLAHFEEDREFYLVQALVVGEPLSRRIVLGDRWSEERAIALLNNVLRVLSYVHQQGVIHRDIKPDNLLQTEDGQTILIDFGAVKALPQAASTIALSPQTRGKQNTLTVVVGTADYMPAEQRNGQPRFSSDIYAVGITLIQAVTGLSPSQLTHSDRTGEIEWLDCAPQISPRLGELLSKMVRYDFRQRYVDAQAATTALSDLLASSSAPANHQVGEYLGHPQKSAAASVRSANSEVPEAALLRTMLPRKIRRKWLAIAPLAILCVVGSLFAFSNFLASGDADSQRWAVTLEGIEQGDAAFDEQSYQVAIDAYLDALVSLRETGQPPTLSDEALEGVHRRVCYSLHRLDRFDQADEACADALALADDRIARQPNSAAAYYGRAQALAGLRRFDEAQADIKKAQTLASDTGLKADLLELQIEVVIDMLES